MLQSSPTRRQNEDLTIEPVLLCSAHLYSVQISNISNGIIIDADVSNTHQLEPRLSLLRKLIANFFF